MRQAGLARITTLTDANGTAYRVQEDRPPPVTFGQGAWFIMFDDAAVEIARQLDSAAAWKVLVVLPQHLDWTTWKPLLQGELAAKLAISQPAVNAALAELVRLKLVLRKGKGPAVRWKLPATWGFKGTPGQFHGAAANQVKEGALTPPIPANVAEGILWKEACLGVSPGPRRGSRPCRADTPRRPSRWDRIAAGSTGPSR
jgi:hypothetical protein